jgi:hypothetical protein
VVFLRRVEQETSLNSRTSAGLHGVTPQTITFFTVTAVKTSNLTKVHWSI